MEQTRGNKRPNPVKRTSTLYIANLDPSVTDRDLKEECSKFGNIKRVTIIKDKETRTSKGFGYLLFRSEDEATKALKELDGRVIADKPVKCKYSHSETPEWQMILDSRRQNGGMPPPMMVRGRGGFSRGQGRGQNPMRGGYGQSYGDEQDSYESQRGRPPVRGRGGPGGRGGSDARGMPPSMRGGRGAPGSRGAPGGRGGSMGRGGPTGRGGPPSRGASSGRGMPAGGRGILETPSTYDQPKPSYREDQDYGEPAGRYKDSYDDGYGDNYGDSYGREYPPARERPAAPPTRERDPYERQPAARYDDRQSSDYNDRQSNRYDDRQPARYGERQSTMYDDRYPPSRDGRSILPEPRSNGRPIESSRQDDYDPYGPPSGGRQAAREPVSRGPIQREPTSRETSMRNQYLYDRPSKATRGRPSDTYSSDRYAERAPLRSEDRRGIYDAPSIRDRQAPPTRDPYEQSRKRPATGYAGYDDVYDQPPSRVARAAPANYGY